MIRDISSWNILNIDWLSQIIVIESQWNFAHAITAMLWWHLQNCIVTEMVESQIKGIRFGLPKF